MPEAAVEEATPARAERVATTITATTEPPPALLHRVVMPLAQPVQKNYFPVVVVDPVDSMTQPATQAPLAMGAELFMLPQIQSRLMAP